MRGGLSTIQQTLTPEAAEVLKASMAEAGRRNHGQTTPLHVAATLLSSPSGFLRQACVRSHPNSSHPLQCRALELCFSVALERLPATATSGVPVDSPPPPSNALMAALKRAQAHQRRGCPEQQQPPLLAVKVELEQLVISILDDPGVSRVMREASFSSPAVKTAIQQSQPPTTGGAGVGLGFRPSLAPPMSRNMYVNPRLQQGNPVQLEPPGNEVMKRISDIFSRSKKRNPILVGENDPQSVMNEFWMKFAKEEFGEGVLRNIEVIQLDKGLGSDKVQLFHKIRELGPLIEAKVGDSHGNGGVVLDLGDLKWLVEAQPPGEAEAGRGVVDEVAKVLARFGEGGNGRLWLIGTATCETYLRCQIYYPSMETDWDLQAVPIAPRSPFPGMFPRLGVNGILNSSVESLGPMKTFQSPNAIPRRVPGNLDPARTSSRCPQCSENYEQELAKLVADEYEKSSSEVRSEPAVPPLPQWLQKAKFDNGGPKSLDKSQTKDQEMAFKQKTEELQKKWSDTCLRLHPDSHNNLRSQRVGPPMTLYNPKLLLHQPLQNKLLPNNALGASLQLNSGAKTSQPLEILNSHPKSPVRTDLALGRSQITEPSADENVDKDCVKDLLGCISSDFQVEKCAKALDTDSYKMLLKKLMEKVWWQKEAASKVASIVVKCKTGDGKRQVTQSKGGTWLLFTGSDRIGKKKMVSAISEQICGSNPIMISLGRRRSDEETAMNFRGKTVLDRIVEAVRRNPFSVIMLEDIDEANMLVRGSITRAMERGRLADSYGREISLGNVIFILTTNWLPNTVKKLSSDQVLDEDKLGSVSSSGWQLRLRICKKRAKRRLDWLHDRDRLTMPRRESNVGLSLDLNLMADFDDDRTDGSLNSSDLTTEHDDDQIRTFPITSVPIELADFIDDAVVFKPVDTVSVRNEIRNKISEKFSNIVDDISLEIEEEALENILGGVWFGRTDLEEWGDRVLLPSFRHIKTVLPSAKSSDENFVIRLEIDGNLDTRGNGDLLPSSIRV